MKTIQIAKITVAGFAAAVALTFAIPPNAAAHCDTLDGPVIQDAHKALEVKDITPILKWVKAKDEKAVKAAFQKALAAKEANAEAAHNNFFTTLVKIHRAGEGAPFTGLKPAGAVEPAVAETDKALASGSADALVKLVTDDITAGIKKRYERVAAAYKHKDESVALGREFVEAYVEFTHYVEKLHMDATGKGAHNEHKEQTKQHGGHAGHGADKH
ncbi:hypothetical protein RW64_11855 [Geobacter sulfurreducens]|nr:hypothetical protein RW64_11855 [Geobacter sulfurreducens]